MKKRKIILFVLLFISCFAFELFFCNSLFLRGKSHYVFSCARIFAYALFFVICGLTSNSIISNRIKYKKKKINILDIFIILSIIFVIGTDIVLLTMGKVSIMSQGPVIISICYLIFLLLFYSNNYKLNILLLCLVSLIYSIGVDPQFGFDEPNHFLSSYNIAHFDYNFDNGYEINKSLDKISMYKNFDNDEKLFVHYNRKVTKIKDSEYKPVNEYKYMYIPSSIGIFISELFHGTIMDTFYMGRIFNCLLMIALIAILLLKLIPFKLNSFVAIIMTPFFIMLGSSYSIDALGALIIMIFIAYVFKLYKDKQKYLSIKNVIVLLILMLMIVSFKSGAYFFIFLLLGLLYGKVPKNKRWLIILFGVIFIFILYNKLVPSDLNTGDERGIGENNIQKQLEFLFSSPIVFITVYVRHFFNCFFSPSFYYGLLGDYFFPIFGSYFTIPYIIYLIYMGLDSDDYNFSKKNKIFIFIVAMLIFFFTSTALYLAYTEVGSLIIDGYQSRYTFIIIVLLLLIISNNKIMIKKTKNHDYINFSIITMFNITFLFIMLFSNILKI